MVARRKKKTTRRNSRQKGVSLIGMAETYMLTGVVTNTLFNVNPVEFFMGSNNEMGVVSGTNKIGIRELFSSVQGQTTTYLGGRAYTTSGTSTTEVIKSNLKNNAVTGIMGMILIPLGFKAGKQLARPATSRINRLLGKAGVANTVKL